MTAISLTVVLLYLLGLERADKMQNKVRKIEQYKQDVGCYLFNL